MKILYFTTDDEDYLQDSILYGLRMKFGADLVDAPQKMVMYENSDRTEIYGHGFTLWGLLPNIPVDRENILERAISGEFDYVIFSSIWRQQMLFAHFVNFRGFKDYKTKFVFLDGEDDGFPCVADAFNYGTYFKRENPYGHPQIKIIGLSIPRQKMMDQAPEKTKTFTKHVQCSRAYDISEVLQHCTMKGPFDKEEDYYRDLTESKYGITMKKSGWDVPRHIENAGHYVVNCIYSHCDWDGTEFADKPAFAHPLGFEDMKNCIIWHTPEELMAKIEKVDKVYQKVSQASRDWAETKSCEAMADYLLKNI